MKQGKPAPDIFEVALARFYDASSSPKTSLVFEDSWNGVCAGLAAGMYVVWVPEAVEVADSPPEPNLTEEMKARLLRISTLEEFDPTLFGLPPYASTSNIE